MMHSRILMSAESFVSVQRFVLVISLLVRLLLRERLSLQQRRDFFVQSLVRKHARFVILPLRYHTVSMVSL